MSNLLVAAASLRAELAGFEPGVYGGADCARIAEELARTEKACAGVRLLAAARAVDSGAHGGAGFSDGAAWLARQTGVSPSAARAALDTAGALDTCPDTKLALLAGEVSVAQAGEITRAESETSGAEWTLLPVARNADLSKLREAARQHKATHTDVEELAAQQHAARSFRHWRDRAGMVCFSGALEPRVGVGFIHRLELAAHRLRRDARASGAAEPWETVAADAFAAMVSELGVSGAGGGRSPRSELVVVCDLNAWRRGHVHPGEVCHIIDGGPIPLRVAKELSEDAFVKAVLHDGVNIHTVSHFGRHLPAELRTALDLGPVPGLSGAACVDCGCRWALEYDHVDPVANNGPTSYANVKPRCWPHHQEKTERDRQAGLLGPKGAKRWPPEPP